MSANFKHAFLALAILVSSALAVDTPLAADGVTVNVNMARILRINSPASTVIIGNPAIADVTIQDSKTLILTGKAFGQTNLIILDSIGNPIADTLVDVVQQEANLMTVYQGRSRTTMVCDPVCQPTLMLGDDPGYTSDALASSQMISSAASGN